MDQLRWGFAVATGVRDPDAGLHRQAQGREVKQPGQRLVEASGDRVSLERIFEILTHDHELIPGQARQGVPGPQHFGQAFATATRSSYTDLVLPWFMRIVLRLAQLHCYRILGRQRQERPGSGLRRRR